MRQSRRMSLVEAAANVVIGYGIAVATQVVVFPIFGIRITLADDLRIGLVFAVVSILRSYALRRLFEVCPADPADLESRRRAATLSGHIFRGEEHHE